MTESREDLVDTEYVAPEGELEQAVAGISAEVLDVSRVGRTDSFYDFGTTSLQAVRICTRIQRQTGISAPPVWLFDSDVLADFVQRLGEARTGGEVPAAGEAGADGDVVEVAADRGGSGA
jgi:hypothetical protein